MERTFSNPSYVAILIQRSIMLVTTGQLELHAEARTHTDGEVQHAVLLIVYATLLSCFQFSKFLY